METLTPSAITVVLLFAMTAYAEVSTTSLTLEDYTKRAVDQGIQGKLNELALESAGYAREIIFRQTDSPAFTLNHTNMRGQITTNGSNTVSNAQQSNLQMNETTPLGTTMNMAEQWADAGGTSGPLIGDAIARPGFTANVTQPVYLFVKNPVMRTRKEAELTFANAKSAFQSMVLSLRTQARTFYYNVMLDEDSIKADERKVESSQKLLDVTQALVDAGKSAPIEIMRAKIQLGDDQRQLMNDQVLKDQALLQAKDFAFLSLDADITFVTALQFFPFKVPLERLTQYALLHNPDLESLRRDKDLALLNYESSVEPTRPTLSVNGTYDSNQAPDVVTHGWTWTSTVNWLFFDSFVTRDQAREARIAQWVADLNLQDAERTTRVNVESDYLDIKRTEKQIQDFQFTRDQAQRNVDVLRLRFQHGLATLLDVLDADNQMRSLDNEYLGLLVQFNESKDKLSQQIGADVETLQ